MAEEIQQLSHRLKKEIDVGVGLEDTRIHPPHFNTFMISSISVWLS